MQDSIFTKIVKGELPSHKIYEDDLTLAFLDIHPVQPGMTVVVSKKQVENFEDLPDEDYAALWQAVRQVARKLRATYPGKAKIAVQVEGLDIADHTHVKVFPISTVEELTAKPAPGEPDHSALAALAEKIRSQKGA